MNISIPQADFTPQLTGYTGQGAFRFWCQKVLPLVYDDSLSYYELLNKVVIYLNNIIKDVSTAETNIDSLATAFRLLEEYVNNYTLVVNPETVKEILESHPEWTTTVQDSSITNAKLNKELKDTIKNNSVKSGSLVPIYTGDYIADGGYIAACCIRVGDFMYCLDTRTAASAIANHDDYGIIHKFDLVNNVEVTDFKKRILVGHGNSICHDTVNNLFYIAPTATYVSGAVVAINKLYVYDEYFQYLGDEDIPEYATGVSYDHKTGKLYFYNNNSKNIYAKENDNWSLVCTVDFANVDSGKYRGGSYNQDFSVFDDTFYISSPSRNIIYGQINEIESVVRGCLYLTDFDASNRFRFGELEGMEFYEDGKLYASCFEILYTAYSSLINCFVVELGVGSGVTSLPVVGDNALYYFPMKNYTLSNGTVGKFTLGGGEIRTLHQLPMVCANMPFVSVTIPDDSNIVEPFMINILQNVYLIINGNLTTAGFLVSNGTLSIASGNTTHLMTMTGEGTIFQVRYNGGLKLVGDHGLRVKWNASQNNERNLVNVYSDYVMTIIRVMPQSLDGLTWHIGSSEASSGVWVGQSKLVFE